MFYQEITKLSCLGNTTLFSFWDLYLFELIYLFMYQWFPNDVNQSAVLFGSYHQLLMNLLKVRECRNEKIDFRYIIIKLSKCLWKAINTSVAGNRKTWDKSEKKKNQEEILNFLIHDFNKKNQNLFIWQSVSIN